MNLKITVDDRARIVYDADKLDTAPLAMFRPGYWPDLAVGSAHSLGRGGTRFVSAPCGDAVLKMYLRGGQMARWNRDLYFFTGLERSRSFREFRLLAWMHEHKLPVPAPVAALVETHGLAYRGALISMLLAETSSFAEHIQAGQQDRQLWQSVGRCIRRFHDAGVMHADLNVNNILVADDGQVFLVDFDKSSRRKAANNWKQANMDRLKRSLEKLQMNLGSNWADLRAGYD